jgi:hypothetical protein
MRQDSNPAGMDWGIWLRKLWRGAAVAAMVGVIGYLSTVAEAASKGDHATPYVVLAAPMVLHLLGQAANWAKHWGTA